MRGLHQDGWEEIVAADDDSVTSDGSSPKKTSPGRAQALKVEVKPGPILGPSEKVKPEP